MRIISKELLNLSGCFRGSKHYKKEDRRQKRSSIEAARKSRA